MPDYSSFNDDHSLKTCRGPCKKSLPVEQFRKRNDHSGKKHFIRSVCRQCESDGVAQYRTMTKKGIIAEILRRKKSFSITAGIEFDLTAEWVSERLDAQEWKCALTGLSMNALKVSGEKRSGYRWDAVSVDRITPKGGYTKANVRFVLNAINLFKNDGDDDRMYMIAKALILNKRRK